MQKHLIPGSIGLVVGLIVGFAVANSLNRAGSRTEQPMIVTGQVAQPANGQPAAGMQPDVAETIQKAESDPENFPAQMRAGDMFARIGKFDRAIEFYRKGLAIEPKDFKGNVVLANALFDAGKFEEASKVYENALAIDPSDPDVRTDHGASLVERASPDYASAIKEFEKVLEKSPKHEPALYYLGLAYYRSGDQTNAQKTLARLESANPASDLIKRLKENYTK